MRSVGRRLALFGTAAVLIAAPALVAGTAANAAVTGPFAITTPTQGQTGVAQAAPGVVGFAGTGLPTADDVTVTYVGATGTETASTGGATNDGNGAWTELENFNGLGPGITTVTATVTVVDATGAPDTAVQPAPQTLTFTLATAPNSLTPFAITSPVSNAGTVVNPGDAFTGTGTPTDTITIVYGARAGQNLVAGTGTVDATGNWSIVPDFSQLEPGQTDGTAIITETTPAGAVEAGTSPTSTNFTFATAPAPAIPVTLTTDPASSTLSSATTKGVAFAATGFSPDEQVTISVKDQSGAVVDLAPAQAQFFASATDGSFIGFVILPTTAGTGTYTVTVTGVRTGRAATGTFTVVPDPVTTTPASTPVATPVSNLPVVSG